MQLQKILNNLLNERTWEYLLLLMAVSIPFGPALPNIVIGILAGFWLLLLLQGRLSLNRKIATAILMFSCFFLWYGVTFFYSENTAFYTKKLTLLLPLLVFPILMFSTPFSLHKKTLYKLGLGFSISVLLLLMLSLSKQISTEGFSIAAVTGNELSQAVTSIHYLSLSLYTSFAALFCVYAVLFMPKQLGRKTSKITVLAISLLLIGFLIILGGRTSIGLLLFFLLIFLVVYAIRKRKILVPALVFGSAVFLITTLVVTNKKFQEKWKEIYAYESINAPDDSYWGGTGMRILIWDCAVKIAQNNPVLGVGLGDDMDQLKLCYKVYMKNQLLVEKNYFHAHNMYLQSLVRGGVVGLVFFLLSFIFGLYKAWNHKNGLYLVFLLLFMLSGITESFFMINAGVLFFAFFNAVLFKKSVEI